MESLLDKLHRYEAYVPLYLRVGLGIVFVMISLEFFIGGGFFNINILNSGVLNFMMGTLETVIGISLLLGFKHQLAAIAAGIQIIIYGVVEMMSTYGAYGKVMISISLLSIAFSLAVTPETILSIDAWRERKRLERVRP